MNRMDPQLHIAVINDDVMECERIKYWLDQDMRMLWAMTRYSTALEAGKMLNDADVIIFKAEQGVIAPQEVYRKLEPLAADVPIIVLTDAHDGGRALGTFVMERGAADTLVRGQFARLVDAVEFALIRHRITARTRRAADANLRHSQDEGMVALEASRADHAQDQERSRAIMRMLVGAYAVDQVS